MSDVAIIGAGVVGCAIARELVRRGARTTVIDRHGEAGHGSTSASCGIVRRFYSTPTMTAMAEESARIWSRWADHLGVEPSADLARFERSGMLFILPQVGPEIDGILAHMRALGVEAELLDAEGVTRRFPFLDGASHAPIRAPDDEDFFEETGRAIAGAVFEPGAGLVFTPMLATTNLRAAGERDGVVFRLGHAVEAIRHGHGAKRFRLELEGGEALVADVVVNVAGPHSTVVNRMAGVTLPIELRALRREVCAVENPLRSDGSKIPIVADLDSGIYLRPESGGHDLAVGSLDPASDPREWVDPDAFDQNCSVAGFDRQVMRAMKRLPELELGRRRGLADLYDVTLLDWNPVLDRTDLPGFYVAIGTSGSSFKTAPVIGALMARLIDACEGGLDHDRDPLRMRLAETGFEVDVAFFSRLRGAHVSTGTVLG